MLEELLKKKQATETLLAEIKEAIRHEKQRLAHDRKKAAAKKPGLDAMEKALHEKVRTLRIAAADALIARGATWKDIERDIGVSKQQVNDAKRKSAYYRRRNESSNDQLQPGSGSGRSPL